MSPPLRAAHTVTTAQQRRRAGAWLTRSARIAALGLLGAAVTIGALLPGGGSGFAAQADARDRWGIDQLLIRRSAGGHLLDLRFRVVDPSKAAAVLARDASVHILDTKSGTELEVPSTPKAGPLRNSGTPELGRTYFALFSNPGHLVRRGDQVSVVIAGQRLGDLPVR
jgi:hypothetical protein